jgi:hypothetical protein
LLRGPGAFSRRRSRAVVSLTYGNPVIDRAKAPKEPKIIATFKGCHFDGWYVDTGSWPQIIGCAAMNAICAIAGSSGPNFIVRFDHAIWESKHFAG